MKSAFIAAAAAALTFLSTAAGRAAADLTYAPNTTATTGEFTYTSGPNAYITAGVSHADYTVAGGVGFTGVRYLPGNGSYSNDVAVQLDNGYRLELIAPNNTPLTVGSYPLAMRIPFQPAGVAGLDLSSYGREDDDIVGSFDVLQVAFTPAGGLSRLAVNFVQYDDSNYPYFIDDGSNINGALRFNSTIPVPEPVGTAVVAAAGVGLLGRRRRR